MATRFFPYALDQVFLMKVVYPRMQPSMVLTFVRLANTEKGLRELHRQEEMAAAPSSPSRKTAVENRRKRREWLDSHPTREEEFSLYCGLIHQADFPRPVRILAWMMEEIEKVREKWKGKGRGGGEWKSVGVEWLYERASPGHFIEGVGVGRESEEWEALVSPPSATSPRDFEVRWKRERERVRERGSSHSPRPLARALSFSAAHPSRQEVSEQPLLPRLPLLPVVRMERTGQEREEVEVIVIDDDGDKEEENEGEEVEDMEDEDEDSEWEEWPPGEGSAYQRYQGSRVSALS